MPFIRHPAVIKWKKIPMNRQVARDYDRGITSFLLPFSALVIRCHIDSNQFIINHSNLHQKEKNAINDEKLLLSLSSITLPLKWNNYFIYLELCTSFNLQKPVFERKNRHQKKH